MFMPMDKNTICFKATSLVHSLQNRALFKEEMRMIKNNICKTVLDIRYSFLYITVFGTNTIVEGSRRTG
jgi:hypothetical protein